MTRNEIFAYAVDYLYKEGMITGQSDLAEKTGITETTISRIINNKVRKPSEDSLRRLNSAFGNIFNPRWLRGEPGEMLANNPTSIDKKEIDPTNIMSGIENLLEISANLIKENEALRREFKNSVDELSDLISQLKDLHPSNPYKETHPGTFGVSDYNEEFKK